MDSSDESGSDSDRELQAAFQTGLLKPGLAIEAKVPKREYINDQKGLRAALKDLSAPKKDLPWIERLDLSVDPAPAAKAVQAHMDTQDDNDDQVHNDFKREMKFYRLAQACVLEAIPRLHSMGVATRRPDDYFAEMVKTDDHMKKVREKLLSKQVAMERSSKAKKMRELRKYGKKVQQEVLLKRQKEKKEMMQQVKKYRKGKIDSLDFLNDSSVKQNQKSDGNPAANKKRQYKNKKFGFGGQKKRSKHNTAESSASMGGYSVKKHGSVPSKYQNKNKKHAARKKTQRPGKSKRQKLRSKV